MLFQGLWIVDVFFPSSASHTKKCFASFTCSSRSVSIRCRLFAWLFSTHESIFRRFTTRTYRCTHRNEYSISINERNETRKKAALENRLSVASIFVFDNVQLAGKGDIFALKWFMMKNHKTISYHNKDGKKKWVNNSLKQ